jgi:hypothetical protein
LLTHHGKLAQRGRQVLGGLAGRATIPQSRAIDHPTTPPSTAVGTGVMIATRPLGILYQKNLLVFGPDVGRDRALGRRIARRAAGGLVLSQSANDFV